MAVLTEPDKQTLRSQRSYRVAVVAARVTLCGFALMAGLGVLAAKLPVLQSIALPVIGACAVLVAAADMRLTALRFQLRGRKLLDTAGRRQYSAMFARDVLRFRHID